MLKKFLINKEKEKILTENQKIINQEKNRYSIAEVNYQKDIEIIKNNIKNRKILKINDNDRPKIIKSKT